MADNSRRYRVVFFEPFWAEDLARLSPSGRDQAVMARRELEQDGISTQDTLPCRPLADDGTRLPGCRKRYIPASARDPYRIVLAPTKDSDGKIVFLCVAFGLGHPPRDSNVPDAYKLAHSRIHGERL